MIDSYEPRVGAQILIHAPEGDVGRLTTQAAAVAVRSLFESDIPSTLLRVVVVDNGSTHLTFHEWLQEKVYPNPQVRVVRIECTSFSRGRNVGYRRLLEWDEYPWDIALEFDVDNIFPKVWFEPLRRYLATHPQVGLLSPGTVMSDHWEPCEVPTAVIDYETMHYDEMRRRVNKVCAICRAAFGGKRGVVRHPPVLKRRVCLEDIGLYDEGYEGGGWEDWDEVMRAHKGGWLTRTCLDSFVFHWTAWSHVLNNGWVGENPVRLYQRNQRRFFSKFPDSHDFYREYLRNRGQLYHPSARLEI